MQKISNNSMKWIILSLYLMNEVPICIFSHFAIEPGTFLGISDYSYDIKINWSFGGIVYFRCILDSARSIMYLSSIFSASRDPQLTKPRLMIGINRILKAIVWRQITIVERLESLPPTKRLATSDLGSSC